MIGNSLTRTGARRAAAMALLALAVFAAYAPAWRAGLIWDDDFHFASNPQMHGLRGLFEIWTSRAGLYYPLTLTTFWFLHKLFGFHPLPYHALTILLHAANALLLWHLLARLKIPGAGWAAALFALHPVHVESVAWVTELKNTQSGFFFLLSLLAVERSGWLDRPAFDARWFGLGAVAFVLALLSKTSTVMLPFVLVLMLWWRGRLSAASLRPILPFFVAAAVAAVWTVFEQRYHSGALGFEWSHRPGFRLALAGHTLWFYLLKLLWPHPLIFFYPKWPLDAGSPAAYLPLAAWLALFGLLWAVRRDWAHAAVLALLFFTLLLAPVMGFFNVYFMRYTFVADHFQYLASMGPLALLGAGLSRVRFGSAAAAVALAACGVLAWRHAHAFQDERALWLDTLKKNPAAWMVHNNLGAALQNEGDAEGALRHYEAAVRFNPDHYEALNNLGNLLADAGRLDEAESRYRRAVELRPDFTTAMVNLGLLFEKRGRLDLAREQYDRALAWNPRLVEAWVKLAALNEKDGRMLDAVSAWKRALELKQASPQAAADFFFRHAHALSTNGQAAAAQVYLGEVERIRRTP